MRAKTVRPTYLDDFLQDSGSVADERPSRGLSSLERCVRR